MRSVLRKAVMILLCNLYNAELLRSTFPTYDLIQHVGGEIRCHSSSIGLIEAVSGANFGVLVQQLQKLT